MRSSGNNEQIDLKCKAFQRSIESLIGKIQKSRTLDDGEVEECHHLVRHANHVLRTLSAKRTSLSRAIVAFRDVSARYVAQFSAFAPGQENDRRRLLRKWFAIYLRLRDGFVLLESGEQRHVHDGDDERDVDVSQSKYPSRLSDAYRGDGVTRKFSSAKGYTGAGYDEFYDDDMGIKKRLLDAVAKVAGKSCAFILQRTFERDGHGAQMWESEIDALNNTSGLRDDLNAIREDFVGSTNKHLKTKGSPDVLKLITDDKAERITLGLLDIAREGNAFTISEAGGSLPFGLTTQDWKKKFSLVAQHAPASVAQQPQCKNVKPKPKKKRKVILEDSSSEEEEAPPPKKAREKQSVTAMTSNKDGHDNDDGLAVRVRKATDVRNTKAKHTDTNSTSINEMKQQHGVDNARLEQGRDHLEGEQLRSKMAADDEDLREEFLGGGGCGGGGGLRNHIPLLKACLDSKSELRRNEWYANNDNDLLWEGQSRWAHWEDSLDSWRDCFQALLHMRREVDEGTLDESSDRAYILRDNFRESCINLGNDCIEVHEFFFSRLQNNQQTSLNRSNPTQFSPRASLDESMSKVCHSCLGFAEETFKTALSLVLEQERCQDLSPTTIGKQWEKGQHFLLRGRAHHSIGRALYELAQYYHTTSIRQLGSRKSKDFMLKARKECDNAVQRAKFLRRNAVLIRGHADARETSTQNDCSWAAEGVVHFLEAIKLESLTSGLQIACLCKLDHMKDVEERFGGFFGSVDTADIVECVSVEGVTHREIAETLDDTYCFAMKVAELLIQSLESMARKKGLDALAGDKLLQMTRAAMKRAASISEQLLSFLDQLSLEYEKEHIVTKAAIEKEEHELIQRWETVKSQAQRKLSDIVQIARANDAVRSALPRTEMGECDHASPRTTVLPRRVFIQDGRPLHGRSTSSRTRGVKKKNTEAEDRATSKKFSSEFGSDNNTFTTGGDSTGPEPLVDNATIVYRKWGDEILEEQKRTCPPLPDGLPINVRRALEKKLRGILPTNRNSILT